MKKEDKKLVFIFARYVFLLLLAIFAFSLFYAVFLPLTIYPVGFLLNFFYSSHIQGSTILLNSVIIELIEACIAGSAYYLLLLLNLAVPMPPGKRILALIFSFALFLAINILRISAFSLLYINNFKYFSITHLLFWYLVSGIIVFLIWLATIKVFSIKEIPFYTDLKLIYHKTKLKQTGKRRKE